MTEAELKAIEERAAKATPGPWTVEDRADTVVKTFIEEGVSVENFPFRLNVAAPPFALGAIAALFPNGQGGTVDFIAHARKDVPALISEVRRLRDMISGLVYSAADAGFHGQLLEEAEDYLVTEAAAWPRDLEVENERLREQLKAAATILRAAGREREAAMLLERVER